VQPHPGGSPEDGGEGRVVAQGAQIVGGFGKHADGGGQSSLLLLLPPPLLLPAVVSLADTGVGRRTGMFCVLP